jgi:hypothetical protein
VLFDAGSRLDVVLIDGFKPQAGDRVQLFAYSQAPTGLFDSFVLPDLRPGLSWNTSDLYAGGWLSVDAVAAVPEPGTGALLLAGGALLGWRARRRLSGW